MLLLSGSPLKAADYQLGAGVEYFSWREYIATCPRILEERGPRFFLSLNEVDHEPGKWDYRFQGKVYAAAVLYDGFYQNCAPLTATTTYIGAIAEAGITRWLGEPSPRQRLPQLGINFGLGFDTWRRTIVTSGGYSEDYAIGFARLGLAAKRGKDWSAQAGIKHPFSTYEVAHLQAAGFSSDAVLRPKGAYSYFANIKYQPSRRYTLLIYYDGYRFNASDSVPISGCPTSPCAVHQPTSHQDTVGFTLFWNQ
ncbi:MAG: hypothetical protein V3R65_08280 [Acidiferrobacterales bacterium]